MCIEYEPKYFLYLSWFWLSSPCPLYESITHFIWIILLYFGDCKLCNWTLIIQLPLAAMSIVDANNPCCPSICPKVNHLGNRLKANLDCSLLSKLTELLFCKSRIGNLMALIPILKAKTGSTGRIDRKRYLAKVCIGMDSGCTSEPKPEVGPRSKWSLDW